MPVLVSVSDTLGTCRSIIIGRSSRQTLLNVNKIVRTFGSSTTSYASDLAQYEFTR